MTSIQTFNICVTSICRPHTTPHTAHLPTRLLPLLLLYILNEALHLLQYWFMKSGRTPASPSPNRTETIQHGKWSYSLANHIRWNSHCPFLSMCVLWYAIWVARIFICHFYAHNSNNNRSNRNNKYLSWICRYLSQFQFQRYFSSFLDTRYTTFLAQFLATHWFLSSSALEWIIECQYSIDLKLV